MRPTQELYEFFTRAYGYFNATLFGGGLAPCMITVQRQKGCMGLFYPERWITENAEKCHELALNPTYFGAYRVVELFQTLVHEQCHLWQQEYGRPSRSGYHNREWSNKMASIGLMPSSTGEPGGKRTGQHMSDYPLSGGLFLQTCRQFVAGGGKLKWMDRYRVPDRPHAESPLRPLEESTDEQALLAPVTSLFHGVDADHWLSSERPTARNKIKYTCPGCGCNAWGKPGLRLRCEMCDRPLRAQ